MGIQKALCKKCLFIIEKSSEKCNNICGTRKDTLQMQQVTALILAAGEGKRMKSKKAKVLHQVCGKAMIEWVYEAVLNAGIEKCVAIVGHRAEQVMKYMGSRIDYVFQRQQLGTGHAVQQASRYYDGCSGYILVLYGDTPLISAHTIKSAIEYAKCGDYKAVVITADMKNAYGYGRIVRDENGNLVKIVEQRDASDREKEIREINSGMYVFSSGELGETINLLSNDNDQGEYYLTDLIEIMISKGYRVGTYKAEDSDEVLGVNDPAQLRQVSAVLEKRIARNIHQYSKRGSSK
jgi:bifunctional UDP-N-acetylglucosamine pyrophosphorylase/glucosamine-1-phosphate N-acetyltransferase